MRVRIMRTCAHTQHIFTCTSKRTSVGVRARVGGEHTGDVILTKGRNNIGVDLLKEPTFSRTRSSERPAFLVFRKAQVVTTLTFRPNCSRRTWWKKECVAYTARDGNVTSILYLPIVRNVLDLDCVPISHSVTTGIILSLYLYHFVNNNKNEKSDNW